MRYRHALLPLGMMSLSLSVPSIADEQVLDTVTVWATEIRASSVQLDKQTIDSKQADHISDLLRPLPGVDVGGAHSLNQRITIRSMDDKDLRISIDGSNQNTYMYHHMGNLQINANILKSVEIDVGNNSVVNGGLGGAVRFETKSAQELLAKGQQFGGHVQASYSDNAANSYSLTTYGLLTPKVDVLAYYNLIKRDNYQVGGGEILDAQGNKVAGTDGQVRGLKGELNDTLIKFGWQLEETQRLTLAYEAYEDAGNYSYRPDMGLATGLAIANNLKLPLTYPTEFTRNTLTLNHQLELADNTLIKSTLFSNQSELWRDETAFNSSPRFAASAGYITGKATNTGFTLLANTILEKATQSHDLTYGLELINYDTDFKAQYLNVPTASSSEKAQNAAIFIQDNFMLAQGLFIIPGVRYHHYTIDSAVIDDSFNKLTGALALTYQPSKNLNLRLSSTQLFKGPEIGEVFLGAGLYDTENPDIEAETGVNHELSIDLQQSLGAIKLHGGSTFFQTTINDYIYDYASTTVFDGKDNVGDMKVSGFEAYVGMDMQQLTVLLTFSRAQSKLSAANDYQSLDGARLDRQQGNSLSLLIDYQLPQWDLSLHWDTLKVAGVTAALDLDGATKDNSKDGYMLHNVSAQWTPRQWQGVTVTVGIDNLLDEYYASQSSRTGVSAHPRFGDLYLQDYEPGRNTKLTVAYKF